MKMNVDKSMGVIPIVPVYNPEPGLEDLCKSLVALFSIALVVDDGSDMNIHVFESLPEGVVLVRHNVNRGKGRAIKTGMEWVRCHQVCGAQGVVFADGDGQHCLDDIVNVTKHMVMSGNVTLGVRDFSASNIPFRSRLGNVVTSMLVRLLFRIRIYDTQTGLRAVPMRLLDAMLSMPGERYEYEMHLFGMLRDCREKLEQVPIQTIYIESNRTSHFRPIRDSIKIYRGLFGWAFNRFIKFTFSSLVGFVVDNLVFTGLLCLLQTAGLAREFNVLVSLIGARLISAGTNFTCNRLFVFDANCGMIKSGRRYVALVALIALQSYVGTIVLSHIADAHGLAITGLKMMVEVVLFVVSYKLQKNWVFK